MRKLTPVQCRICGFETTATGMAGHLTAKHDMLPSQYAEKYGEYRPSKLNLNRQAEENATGKFKCLVCGATFASNKRLLHHVHSVHGLTELTYVEQWIFQNEPQLCPCGCGQAVSLKSQPPYRAKCVPGHNSKYNNGRSGKIVTVETRKLQSIAAIQRGHTASKSETNIELAFKRYLQQQEIQFIPQYPTDHGVVDFYLPELDLYIEIDGSYWHQKSATNLNFRQMSSMINDIRKNKNIPNLIRITDDDIRKNNISFDAVDLTNDIAIDNYDVFLTKEFLLHYRQHQGEQRLRQKADVVLKFIKTVAPTYPHDDVDADAIRNVLQELANSKTVLQDKTFYNNRCSHAGTRELKALFRSFTRSHNLKSITPEQVWQNDAIMRRLIEYRIGLNNSGEVFNISLNQLRRAITVNKYTVSWFKPHLAMDIYREFLGDIKSPTVLDPCAGFGARMLGFYAAYPDGVYVGVEPNPDTFAELVELNSILGKSSILINDRFEAVDTDELQYDLAFTSIPYWNLEIYSTDHTQHYENLNDWQNKFLNKIQNMKRMIVNIPESLRSEFNNVQAEYFIYNNTSHFNSSINGKQEHVVILF
jgi:very-short-patch-repair endonuclease